MRGRVVKIVHEELPGELEALNAWYATIGLLP